MRSDNRRLRRRSFIKAVGGSAATVALAGCLGGDGDGGGSGEERTITLIGHGGSSQEVTISMLEQWGEQREEDITIQDQAVMNNIEIMSFVSENPSEFDISVDMSGNGVALHDLQFNSELFHEIDRDRVPNYTENIQETWRSNRNPAMKDNPYGLMAYMSSQGMAYHADFVDEPSSWQAVKTEEYSGNVSHFDAGLTRFVISAATVGIGPEEALQDDTLYNRVWEEAEEQHQYVQSYWSSGDELKRLYREESAYIGEGWGGQVRELQSDDINVGYVQPEEGVYPGGGVWTIFEASDNKDILYDFLDWMYQRENMIEHSTAQDFGFPYPMKDPPEEVTQLPTYFESPEEMLNINLRNLLPGAQRIAQSWAEVKQG
jgi:spermidine/putrescine-binding protein